MKWFLAVFIMGLISQPAFSETISVQKDGSGDFIVIQDAVDAAASGDTISIGPGRYNDGQVVTTLGWEEFVRVLIFQEELTLIGAGPSATIIGQSAPFSFTQGGHRGIEAGPYFGNQKIWVTGIGFENMRHGIGGAPSPDMIISECRFEGNFNGVFCFSGSAVTVENSEFNFGLEDGLLLYTNSMDSVSISNCNFLSAENGIGYQIGVQFDATLNINVQGCSFFHGKKGLKISGRAGSLALIDGCQFLGQETIGLTSGSSITVNNSFFDQQESGIYLNESEIAVEITDSVFNDVSQYSIIFRFVGSMDVSGCLLSKGEQYVIREVWGDCVKGGAIGLPVLVMENNDWGTVEADSIASWVKVCDYVVDYIPFVGGLVSTDRTTLDGLKAMYR